MLSRPRPQEDGTSISDLLIVSIADIRLLVGKVAHFSRFVLTKRFLLLSMGQ